VLAVVATVAIVYGALPQLGVVHDAWAQASSGDMWWVAGAAVIEVLSFAGYAALFMAVLGGGRIDWPASWLITLSGVAATRLFAAGGTGGVALTAWALRRSGRDAGQTTAEMTSFLLLLYAVYMSALTGAGVVLGVGAIVVVPLLGLLPRQTRRAGRLSLGARLRSILDGIPAGVRRARRLVATRDPLLLGAVAWWTFDIAALAATLHAFGQHLSAAPLIVAYFMGMLGNLLPLPGGIGGVEGGMIGALIACGVDSGAAVGAVLAYRLVSLWLPTACGVIAYGALVRRTHTWTAELETASDSGELPG